LWRDDIIISRDNKRIMEHRARARFI
jgi:hypothetical protein